MTSCNRLAQIGILLAASLLASCSFKKTSEGETAAAPFEVLPVVAIDSRTNQFDAYGFPAERTYQLKICLRDLANLHARAGENVSIDDSESVPTDAEGCVFRAETIAYRHSARERFVAVERKLKASGNEIALHLAIDPWKTDRSAVVDRKIETPAGLVSAADARDALFGRGRFAETDFANVVVENASAVAGKPDVKNRTVTYATQLSGFFLVRRSLEGVPVKEAIGVGKFHVAMATSESADESVVATSENREGEVVQGRWAQPLPAKWSRFPDENVPLEYVFTITPAADSGLRPATARLRTRNRLEISGALAAEAPSVIATPPPVVVAPVPPVIAPPVAPIGLVPPTPTKPAPVVTDPSESDALQISTISYALVRRVPEIDRYLGLTFHRVYDLVIRGTVYRPFASERGPAWERLRPGRRYLLRGAFVAASSFPVGKTPITTARYLNGFEAEIEANGNGDLVGQAVLTVDFTEQPMLESRLRLALEVVDADKARQVKPAIVSIPFQPLEEQGTSDGISTTQTPEALASSLVPKAMKWQRERREGIAVAKPKAAFTKSPRDLFVEHGELPVFVKKADLEDRGAEDLFSFTDLGDTGMTVNSMRALLDGHLLLKSTERAALAKKFCQTYSAERPVPPAALRTPNVAAHHRPQTMNYVDNRSDREKCSDNPLDWVKVREMTFVEEVTKAATELRGEVHRLDVSTSFFREKIESTREVLDGVLKSDSLEAGVVGKVGFEKFGNGVTAQFGYMHRHQWYSATEHSNTEDLRRRYSAVELRTLFADELEFELEASTRRCVLIERTPPSRGLRAPLSSFFLCVRGKDVVREAYYYVSDAVRTGRSPHLDPRDLRDRTWIKLLRGKREYADFQKTISEKTRAIVVKRVVAVGEGVDTLLHDAYLSKTGTAALQRDGGRFPGLVE